MGRAMKLLRTQETSAQPDLRQMHQVQISVAEWIRMADCPIQRDTARHAQKALRAHLAKHSETHRRVACAELPGGLRYKIDGHTRAYLWERGLLQAPEVLFVDVYPVDNIEQVMELYKHFDNPSATENSADRLTGAYRLHKLEPLSQLLIVGGITSALSLIAPKASIYDAVAQWRDQLLWLDGIKNATPHNMPSPLIAAAMLTQRRRGNRVTAFWEEFCAQGGTRIDGKSDGIDALLRVVQDMRARRSLAVGQSGREMLAGKAISCVEAWLADRTYTVGVKATDLRAYLASIPV